MQELSEKTKDTIESISIKIGEKLKEKYGRFESNTTSGTEDKVSGTNTPVNSTNAYSTNLSVEGLQASSPNMGFGTTQSKTQNSNVEFGGKVDFNFNFTNPPLNMSPQQIDEWKKMFQTVVNEQYFRNYLIKVTEPSGTEMATY